MPVYQKAGIVPSKRHIVFRKNDQSLYHEELFGTEGFSSTSSLVYHLYPPTMVKSFGKPFSVRPEAGIEDNLMALSFNGLEVKPEPDYIQSRKIFFFNDDMLIGIAAPELSMNDFFFKNADADELIFIHKGSGTLSTMYGEIEFEQHDYLVIPRGTIYKINFDTDDNRFLFIESFSPVYTPSRYRNEFGNYWSTRHSVSAILKSRVI